MTQTIKNRHIVVIGAARSGVAAACLLQRKGGSVFVSDHGPIRDSMKERLESAGIPYEEGGHSETARAGDFAVVSPGVPDEAPVVRFYMDSGRPVYSELEAASWFNRSPIIGVTGSNGKTTVTSWLNDIWSHADQSAVMAGNIGYAFSDYVDQTHPGQFAILEVSSFQLDHIHHFHPRIGVLLNVTPDHLDRYQNSFEKYIDAKFRLLENQTEQDWVIYNYDDQRLRKRIKTISNRDRSPSVLPFSTENKLTRGGYIQDGNIILNINGTEEALMNSEEIGLRGRHNLKNGLASALTARVADIRKEAIRESLRAFEGVEHRLETVRRHRGVTYINDSKATNVNALWYALNSFDEPVILILGGRDKGNDYEEIKPLLQERVYGLIAIGESSDKIERELSGHVEKFDRAKSLEAAVQQSARWAREGDVVLLSPACASFDMFDDYEHRGEVFKEAVHEL